MRMNRRPILAIGLCGFTLLAQTSPPLAEVRKAAEQGNAAAQFNLGMMYANGQGVTQDYSEAFRWYRKAAEQGNATAQFNLGVMYANGQGVARDDQQAVVWYQKAAIQGIAMAQNNLRAMYESGRALPPPPPPPPPPPKLSDQTAYIVKGLQQPVSITYWDHPDKFLNARIMLGRYRNLSSKVDLQFHEAEKEGAQAKAAGVKTLGTTFVEVANKREEAKDLSEVEVTSALVRALNGGERTACFTLDSGEHALDDTDNRNGYSALKAFVEKSNYKTATIKLPQKAEIPKECTMVVVAGPRRDYLQPEVDALKNYVEHGGRALFMLDPPLKIGHEEMDDNKALTDVLAGWGVRVDKDLVLDLSGRGQVLKDLGPEVVVVATDQPHTIMREMKNVAAAFPFARSLEIAPGDKTTVAKLFSTTENSFATTKLDSAEIKQSPNDKKGPFVLGAAGMYHGGAKAGRFLVVGSSRWAANSFLNFSGNRDLFLNMLNWLYYCFLCAQEDLNYAVLHTPIYGTGRDVPKPEPRSEQDGQPVAEWEIGSSNAGKRMFATATVHVPRVGVYKLALQCADGAHTTTIETFTEAGQPRPITWQTTAAERVAHIREHMDDDSMSNNTLTPTALSHVGQLTLRSLPQTSLVLADVFPNETVEFSFSIMSTPGALAPVMKTKREIFQEMCFSVQQPKAASASAVSTAPVRIGGNIKPPTKTKDVRPVYPMVARMARVQGVVILDVPIDPSGKVLAPIVLQSLPLFDGSAIEAVEQWEYTPTLLNGVAVPVLMTVTVNFALNAR